MERVSSSLDGTGGREGGMERDRSPLGVGRRDGEGQGRGASPAPARGAAPCDEPGRWEAARRGGVTAAALIRPGLALAEGCLPPPAPEHAVLPRAGAGAELAAGRPGAAAALAAPAGAVPLREARGAAVPAAGPAAGALRLVPAGAALLPGARAAAGAAQPAPPRAARLPPPLLPLLLALLLQVPPPGTAPGRRASGNPTKGSCGSGRSRSRAGGAAGAGPGCSISPARVRLAIRAPDSAPRVGTGRVGISAPGGGAPGGARVLEQGRGWML